MKSALGSKPLAVSLFDALPPSVHTIAALLAAIGMKAFYSFTPRLRKNESDGNHFRSSQSVWLLMSQPSMVRQGVMKGYSGSGGAITMNRGPEVSHPTAFVRFSPLRRILPMGLELPARSLNALLSKLPQEPYIPLKK